MAIEATERWSDQSKTITINGDGTRQEQASRAWDVIGAATESEAVNASGIPDVGTSHPSNSLLVMKSKSADRSGGFNYWRVKAIYEIPVISQFPNTDSGRLIVNWGMSYSSEPVDHDAEGNPILNMAGDAIDPPPTNEFISLSLTVVRTEPFYNLPKSLQYSNRVNSDSFNINGVGTIQPGQCYCVSILPASSYASDADSVKVAYQFLLRADPFRFHFLNKGRRGWYAGEGGGATRGDLYYATGEKVSEDVLLFANGTPKDSDIKVTQFGYAPIAAPASAQSPGAVPEGVVLQDAIVVYVNYKKKLAVPFSGILDQNP